MLHKIAHKIALVLLVLYSLQGISPIYQLLEDPAGINNLHSSSDDLKVGILWLGILLDSIVGEKSESATCDGFSIHEHDEEMFLVKHKRALNEQYFVMQPPRESGIRPIDDADSTLTSELAYYVPQDMIHRLHDGYYSLTTGLAPPSLLS